MKCSEIQNLPSAKDLKVIAGSNGLDNRVRWIYVAECFDDIAQVPEWLHGQELVFITGLGLKGSNKTFEKLIINMHKKNVAGLVVNVGPYIKSIPENVLKIADEIGFPLFEIPWETKFVEVTQEICRAIILKETEEKSISNLLDDILFGNLDSDPDILKRAAYYGYDLTVTHQIGIIDIDNFKLFLKENNFKEEKEVALLKADLKNIIEEAFNKNHKKILTTMRSDCIIFLTHIKNEDSSKELVEIIDKIKNKTNTKLKGITISVGIGKCYTSIKNFRKSYKEAEYALIAAKCEKQISKTSYYNEIGIYSLLLSIKDHNLLKKYYQDTMGPLIKYDNMNKTELLTTLQVFLNENFNITNATEHLFIHRNTLNYRLQKIEEILGCSVKSLQLSTSFDMAFKTGKILENVFNDFDYANSI
jgi:DNA-binding PucR family transcriptional regulator